MSPSTSEDILPIDEASDLGPTIAAQPAGSEAARLFASYQSATVATAGGPLASLAGETEALRRTRLFAASTFLAATYGLLAAWTFLSDDPGTNTAGGSRFSLRLGLLGLRCILAAGIAALLAGDRPLTRKQLRAAEYVLFIGLTFLLMSSQYFVGLDLMDRGPDDLPTILAFIKDGVIQMLVLMMIYGTLIPNPPAVAARALAAMFLGPVAVFLLLRWLPGVTPIVARLGRAEDAGANIVFLAIGTALALYGSFLLNGLRIELHKARKYGQYRLLRKLDEGGMGVVYLAEHQLLKRPCALKLIKPKVGTDPIAVARFEREVQSAARLSHPNSIEIYDYGHTDDGTFYYVMEYLQGMSLADMVRQDGPMPPGRAIYLLRQACAGLAEAHALGLVHRDVKPANLFVAVRGGESDVVKVLDFGLVKLTRDPNAAELSREMTVSGTPMFMAPEQAMGDRSLDARADIYALGAVMYYTLTARPPFKGESAFAVMMAHSRDPVVPPSEVRPGVPEDLERVVLTCMAKRPDDRYCNIKALDEALAACASAADWGANRAAAWWAARELGARGEAS